METSVDTEPPKAVEGRIRKGLALSWMKQHLDGSQHPALNTTDLRLDFCPEKDRFETIDDRILASKSTPTITISTEGPPILTQDEDRLSIILFDVKQMPLLLTESRLPSRDEATKEHSLFVKAIEEYESCADDKFKTHINIHNSHTWDEVLDKVSEAEEKYKVKDVKGFWGSLRNNFRKFGENHKAFNAWTGLLPTESHYVSVLCGGLKLILGAAARLHELREETFKAIVEIPLRISETKVLLEEFQKSEALQKCSLDLYVATLQVLGHVLSWYSMKATRKSLKAVFKQSTYEAGLSAKIEDLRTLSDRFHKQALTCSYQTLGEVNRNMGLLRQMSEEDHDFHERQYLKNDAQIESLQAQVTDLQGHQVQASHLQAQQIDVLNKVYVQLQWSQMLDPQAEKLRKQDLRPKGITVNQVLESLSYESDVPSRDVQNCLRLAGTLSIDDQNRAVALMRSPKLRSWLTSISSATLLLNGNSKPVRRSPVSFVCAKLADSLRTDGPLIELHFFCGEHVNESQDSDAHPPGMMNSLLAQLLEQFEFDLADVRNLGEVKNDDVAGLCKVFRKLVMQLPSQSILFCIIDAVFYYEDADRCEELFTAIKALHRLAAKDLDCIFKLLLTSPRRSRHVCKLFGKHEIFDLPSYCPNQGGFTALQWGTNMGRDVEELGQQLEESNLLSGDD